VPRAAWAGHQHQHLGVEGLGERSVWPMKGVPAREICSFETGAVHSASTDPCRATAMAASM